jgi:uncharacterized protein (TIGR02145 family)
MTKFMCKEFLLTLFSLMFGIAGVNAQVTIGADEVPHSGAILDLRSDTTTGKGLKLPVVKIEDASKFQLSADASTAEGMLVFNINPSIIGGHGKGLYVWSNSTWNLVSPTVSASGISLNKKSIKFTTLKPDTLIAEVFPTYSVNKSVSWHSSNSAVATVSQDGIVTPKTGGNAKIYVTTNGSNQSDSCSVTVIICGAYTNAAKTQWLSFMCHNLGADETADPFTPSAKIHGAKYKWGVKNPALTQAADQANAGAIPNWSSITPSPTTNGVNWDMVNANPCPVGWRVPTSAEWNAVFNNNTITRVGSWTNNNYDSGIKVGSTLFLPTAGYRSFDGALSNRGVRGYHLSATADGTNGSYMFHSDNQYGMYSDSRSYAYSVRCVAQ